MSMPVSLTVTMARHRQCHFRFSPRLLVGRTPSPFTPAQRQTGNGGNLDKDLGEIIAALPENYPRHFSIDEQGRFSIGYYQQKQSYFASKESITPTEA